MAVACGDELAARLLGRYAQPRDDRPEVKLHNEVGRLVVEIEGVPFADDGHVETLVSAYKRPELKELDLEGRVGDRPARVRLGSKGVVETR